MLSERDAGYLADILRYIDLAENFAKGYTEAKLNDDPRTLFAVIRCLEMISEASRRVSDDLKSRHPEIRWKEMAAAGNFYRHDYGQVTPVRVWKTLREDIPALRVVVEQELSNAPKPA
jgi:uncharacterized protein with HEPN domain